VFEKPWNLVVYGASAVLLAAGVYYGTNLTLVAMAAMFFVWDLTFAISQRAYTGRSPAGVLDVVTVGREYLSWYMIFFGLFFGLVLSGKVGERENFIQLSIQAGIPLYLLLLPFVFVAVSGLFVPIQIQSSRLSAEGGPTVSPSLKALLFVVTFSQKMALMLMLHSISRIVWSLRS